MTIVRNRTQFQDLFTEILTGLVTVDPISLVDGAGESIGVTFLGAALGDMVWFSAPYDLQDITVTAFISLADTIALRIQNEGGATVNLASGLWKFVVLKTNSRYFM